MNNLIPKSKQEELALESAKGVGEEESLPIFRSFAERYPEGLLRRVYEQALKIPEEKIRKSKGAIFNYLLKKYARQNKSQDPRH